MIEHRFANLALLAIVMAFALPAFGQGRPDPETLLKAQRDSTAATI